MFANENQVLKPKHIVDLSNPNMCRACLSVNAEVQSLFFVETNSVTSLLDMFMTCTSLEISENDGYPKQICKLCIQDLARAFDFRTKCHNSLKELYVFANNTDFKKVINIEVDVSIVKSEADDSCDATDTHTPSNTFVQMPPKTEKIQDPLDSNLQHISRTPDTIQKEVSKTNKLKKARLKPYTCTICDIKFDGVQFLREHKSTHKMVKRCSECTMEFESIEAYKEHLTSHTYLCTDCGRVFHRRAGFKSHRISHSNEQPYECKDCGKKYKTSTALAVHKRNHTGEELYTCEECGKKFITWNSKSSHIITHHREVKTHVCKICNKSFKRKSYLTLHMHQHTGEKPYQCLECLKYFSTPKHRREHMKIHTGEKNFACLLCDKRFIKKSSLKQHMVTHTGERKHSCEVCGKAFTQAHVLRSHMRTHTEIYAQRNECTTKG